MAWCLAGLYGLLAVIHPYTLSGDRSILIAFVAAVSSVLSAAVALKWKRNPRLDQAHLTNFLLGCIALINTVLHFALFQEAVNTTNFVILILGLGLVMLSRISFYAIVVTALISWTIIVTTFNVPEASEWGWFLFFTAFVGTVLEEQRIHATRASGVREALLLTLEGEARKAEHSESLSVLAGGVAHDFNNLLMVILGNIEVLQESKTTSSDAQRRLKSMSEAGSRARDLAQQMLAYAGRAHRKTRTVDLGFLGSEIESDWTHDLLNGIELAFKINPAMDFAVDVDPTQIRQVILNLLTNAGDSGATKITVTVGSEETALEPSEQNSVLENSGYHWLEVSDNGSGMAESDSERIFEPFYTTRKMGTGLGLAASRGIVRAHLGDLTVESKLHRGSQFRMLLPRSQGKPELILNEMRGQLKNVSNETRVLLLEDEELVAELGIAMLKRSGRQVQWVHSFSAFERELPSIDIEHFELALIDVTLGDGSGVEAFALIRARRPDLPVILVSGYDARHILDDQRVDDSVEFLSKPFSLGTLQKSIDNAIERAELRKTERTASTLG